MRTLDEQVNVWCYALGDGWRVAAGKTDRDNDLLSLRYAGQEDWWFHVHGTPGSHVILYHEEGAKDAPDRKRLEVAAGIAAWHSKSRDAGRVPVHCTQAKHVNKPRGARPGTVSIKKERTLRVRPQIPENARPEP